MNDETMVENYDDGVADDTLPEDIVESEDEQEEDIEEFIDDGQDVEEEPAEEPEPQATEPGWIKQRVNKAVQKAIAETEARMQQMFEQQMAPIREKMIEDEAQDLVRSRKVADIETARELVRFRRGQTQPMEEPPQVEQPAPREDATSARIDMLQHQADRIRQNGGPDVIAEFRDNPEIKAAVVRGEMDFYDVAEQMTPKKRPPSPMRSPNGANNVNQRSIESMTDAQFAKLDKMLDEGVRFTYRR